MPETHVAKSNCDNRHKIIEQKFINMKNMNRAALGLVSILVLFASWAVMAGYGAQRKVEVHTAATKEQNKAISEKLDDMRDMQSRILDEVFKGNGGGS